MEIKKGYNKLPLNINLSKVEKGAELWIEFGSEPKRETLSYMDINELLELRNRINKILVEIVS
jgi:hypothetical protein